MADSSGEGLAQRIGKSGILRAVGGAPERENLTDASGAGLAWFNGPDGKWRPFEPRIHPLADANPGRVGRLRAYGNAIDSEVARTFVSCAMECLP